ncbi:MAG: DUF1684 domain-containing protein [Solirubrobacteraceae bacterium]
MSELDPLVLLDWRRRVADLYGEVRGTADPGAAWERWRAVRDELFAGHAASPLPPAERAAFTGLELYDYDPTMRVTAAVRAAEPRIVELAAGDGAAYASTRFARVTFELGGEPRELDLHWLHGYAGGVFLSFTDATSGRTTYGGGRYLLDTIKSADLGGADGGVILDFNFAYNPSCSYDPAWSCPLPSRANRLACAVTAGERERQAAAATV